MEKQSLGFHVIADVSGLESPKLDNLEYLRSLLQTAAETAQVTILNETFHKFEPQGVTISFLLAESHLAIHTWPEYCAACIDFFTCGPKERAQAGMKHILDELKPKFQKITEIDRSLNM